MEMNVMVTTSIRLVHCIPDELLHLILFFFADNVQSLMKFRCICRQWREIGNYSTVWMKFRLVILAPEIYRDFIMLIVEEYYTKSVIGQGTLAQWTDRNTIRRYHLLEEMEESVEISNKLIEIKIIPLESPMIKDHDILKAFQISAWYLQLLSYYHSFWNDKLNYYSNYYLRLRDFYQLYYFPIVVVVMILLIVSMYLIDSVYYPVIQPLTVKQQFAFLLLYFCIILDFFLLIRRPLLKLLNYFHLDNLFPAENSHRRSNRALTELNIAYTESYLPQLPYQLVPNPYSGKINSQNGILWYQKPSFYEIMKFFCIAFALISTLILIQIKLSFLDPSNPLDPSKGITWAITNLPMWIIFGVVVPFLRLLPPAYRYTSTIWCDDYKLEETFAVYYYYFLFILFPFAIWCDEIYFTCQLSFPQATLAGFNQTTFGNQTVSMSNEPVIPSECFSISKAGIAWLNILICIPVVFQFVFRKLYGMQYQIILYLNQSEKMNFQDKIQMIWCFVGVVGLAGTIILLGFLDKQAEINRPSLLFGFTLSLPQTILLLVIFLHFTYFTDVRIFAKIISTHASYENYVENIEI
jgi:hypothetical protein